MRGARGVEGGVSLSLSLSLSLSIYLSIYLSIHPSIHPSIHLSIYITRLHLLLEEHEGARRLQHVLGLVPQRLEVLMKQLDEPGRRTLEMAVRRLGFGCGETERVLRVARTIADLNGDKAIPARAMAEAVQYRALPQLRGWS